MSIRPVNPRFAGFIVRVLRNGVWRTQCYEHAPGISYKFWTYNDADHWVRKFLDDMDYRVEQKTFVYDHYLNIWI